jgi:hypothetical protein
MEYGRSPAPDLAPTEDEDNHPWPQLSSLILCVLTASPSSDHSWKSLSLQSRSRFLKLRTRSSVSIGGVRLTLPQRFSVEPIPPGIAFPFFVQTLLYPASRYLRSYITCHWRRLRTICPNVNHLPFHHQSHFHIPTIRQGTRSSILLAVTCLSFEDSLFTSNSVWPESTFLM